MSDYEEEFFADDHNDDYWANISDMMSGLMIVFLFVAISYMINVTKEKDRIERVAVTYEHLQNELYQALLDEFKHDLTKWDADIDRDKLSIRFKSPDVLFKTGQSNLESKFEEILNDFFPRYVRILSKDGFKDSIEEIRIEGHTSSEWLDEAGGDAYFKNMALSQDRTRSVLRYSLSLVDSDAHRAWLTSVFTANGLSSSRLIFSKDNVEDKVMSRRVEFKVRTNAEDKIKSILGLQPNKH